MSNLLQCRICLMDDNINNLISPCNCQGSIKYAHHLCHNDMFKHIKSNFCGVCKSQYKKEYYQKMLSGNKYIDSIIVRLPSSLTTVSNGEPRRHVTSPRRYNNR